MNISFSLPSILKAAFYVWAVFATFYVVWDFIVSRAYTSGFQGAIVQLISNSKTCSPFVVNGPDNTRAELISTSCLQQNPSNNQAPAPTPEPGK